MIEHTKMHYKVEIERIFKITHIAYESNKYDLLQNKLLFHGARIANVASILCNGLHISREGNAAHCENVGLLLVN